MAGKLKVGVDDLADSTVMRELRAELDIGVVTAVPGCAKGIDAKMRIAELLGIEIPSVTKLADGSGGSCASGATGGDGRGRPRHGGRR